jgi:hypothetical protein
VAWKGLKGVARQVDVALKGYARAREADYTTPVCRHMFPRLDACSHNFKYAIVCLLPIAHTLFPNPSLCPPRALGRALRRPRIRLEMTGVPLAAADDL